MLRKIKNALKPLSVTPLHPQWLCRGASKSLISILHGINPKGIVLDIGCFNKWPKDFIPKSCTYIGLDYLETARDWYRSRPDVYGDACCLPVKNRCIETVLLIDVLEHLESATQALKEIHRVLGDRGTVIMQTPFMYPLHDEPRDFLRLTKFGYETLASETGFELEAVHPVGRPIETGILLLNIALTKTAFGWIKSKSPAALLIFFLPILLTIGNLLAKIISRICPKDWIMPYSYQVIFRKQ